MPNAFVLIKESLLLNNLFYLSGSMRTLLERILTSLESEKMLTQYIICTQDQRALSDMRKTMEAYTTFVLYKQLLYS